MQADRSYLDAVVGVTKFIRLRDLARPRASDNKISRMQEPVGYDYFRESNINALLRSFPEMEPRPEFTDLEQIMARIYWSYGTSRANPQYMHADPDAVRLRVRELNRLTIEEARKVFAVRHVNQNTSNAVLKTPNVSADIPAYVPMKGLKVETNGRYGIPPHYLAKPVSVLRPPRISPNYSV